MDDEKIVELYHARDESAISASAEKYGRYCHSVAYGILGNHEDAQECVSDTYLRAWNAMPPHRPENLRTFLGKITHNLSLDRLDHLSAEKRGAGEGTAVLDEIAQCVPDTSAEETDGAILKEAIDRFLAALSADTRRIFVRRYWFMDSVHEIAARYGVGESKVKVILFRTRNRLRKHLEKEGISL